MRLVFTDLDGTLLDHETYDFSPARPALDRLCALSIPLILASSKTEAEMRPLARAIGIDFPMIVENGAGVCGLGETTDAVGDGVYRQIRQALAGLPVAIRPLFSGFGDWSDEEVAARTGLALSAARLARQRRFSEPGLFSGDAEQRAAFERGLAEAGFLAIQGGRFLTVMPPTSKAERMAEIVEHYRRTTGGTPVTIALGDAPNDIAMLEAADFGVIIANPAHAALPVTARERAGSIFRSRLPGPSGWNEMILKLVEGT